MSELTSSVLDTVRKCSPEVKDLILSELLREKWDLGGRKPELVIDGLFSQTVGVFHPIADPPRRSTLPNFSPQVLAEIQHAIDSPEDTLTTEEAVDFLHREILRRRDKA